MATPKLPPETIEAIEDALSETGGKIRAAHRLLAERGVDVSYGAVHKVAKGTKRCLDPEQPLVRSDIIRRLRKGWASIPRFAATLNCSEASLREAIGHLADSGYNVVWDGPRARIVKAVPSGGAPFVDKSPLVGGWRKFGVISDTHLCSHYQRLDVLEDAYDAFKAEKVRDVYHCGNIVDGHTTFNRFELYAHGITDQAHYCLDHYPRRSGITTHFITGKCHEGWWFGREGMDFGRYLVGEARDRGREDLHYLGFQEVDVELASPGGSAYLRLFHPGKGGAYAYSYKPQKIVESLQGGEKPGVLLVGHYHKAEYVMVRNVHVIQAGCTQDQTRFMRSIPTEAHVAFWVVQVQQDANGAVRRVLPMLTNFYDRGYHVCMTVKD